MTTINFLPIDYDYFDYQGRNYAKIVGRSDDGKKVCIIDSCDVYFWAIVKENVSEKMIDSLIPLLESGKKVIKIIDVNGVKNTRESRALNGYNHFAFFIDAPSRKTCEIRIRGRGDTNELEIKRRLKKGDLERRFYNENSRYFDIKSC